MKKVTSKNKTYAQFLIALFLKTEEKKLETSEVKNLFFISFYFFTFKHCKIYTCIAVQCSILHYTLRVCSYADLSLLDNLCHTATAVVWLLLRHRRMHNYVTFINNTHVYVLFDLKDASRSLQ